MTLTCVCLLQTGDFAQLLTHERHLNMAGDTNSTAFSDTEGATDQETGGASRLYSAGVTGMTRTETFPRITLLASFIASRISMLPSPSLSSKPVLRPTPRSVVSGTASLTGVCSLKLSALPVTELR